MYSKLERFVEDYGRKVLQSELGVLEGFRFEDDIMKSIKDKVMNVRGKKLGDLYDVRQGSFTGCDAAFIIDKKKAEEFLQYDKYKEIIKPLIRGRDIKDGVVEQTVFLIYFSHGFTNQRYGGPDSEGWFKENYYEVWLHFITIESLGVDGVLNRSKRYQGDYWWEFNKSMFRGQFYGGAVLSLVSDDFNVVKYDKNMLPLASLITINGDVKDSIIEFLNSDIFLGVFNNIISVSNIGSVKVKRSSLMNNIVIPNEILNVDSVSNEGIINIYGFNQDEINYLLKRSVS